MLQQALVLHQVVATVGIGQVEVVLGMAQVQVALVLGMEQVEVVQGIERVELEQEVQVVAQGIEQVVDNGEVEHHSLAEKHDDVQVVEEEDGKAQEQ